MMTSAQHLALLPCCRTMLLSLQSASEEDTRHLFCSLTQPLLPYTALSLTSLLHYHLGSDTSTAVGEEKDLNGKTNPETEVQMIALILLGWHCVSNCSLVTSALEACQELDRSSYCTQR